MSATFRTLLVGALLTLAARALADGDSQATLGDGYTLLVDRTGLSVVKGKQHAHLANALSILGTTVDKKANEGTADVSLIPITPP